MTCEQFQWYLSERNALGDAAAADHMERCPECRSLSSTQEELLRCLQAARKTAPQVSESVDAAVMSAYRRERGSVANAGIARRFAWAPIAAALVIAGALWLMRERRLVVPPPAAKRETPTQVQASKEPERVASVKGRPSQKTSGPHRNVAHRLPAGAQPRLASAEQQPPAPGFRNLMYCDPISCSGAMQVIRIQVPVVAMEPFPTARPSRGLVQADVVVGADGVARAIRFLR